MVAPAATVICFQLSGALFIGGGGGAPFSHRPSRSRVYSRRRLTGSSPLSSGGSNLYFGGSKDRWSRMLTASAQVASGSQSLHPPPGQYTGFRTADGHPGPWQHGQERGEQEARDMIQTQPVPHVRPVPSPSAQSLKGHRGIRSSYANRPACSGNC